MEVHILIWNLIAESCGVHAIFAVGKRSLLLFRWPICVWELFLKRLIFGFLARRWSDAEAFRRLLKFWLMWYAALDIGLVLLELGSLGVEI